MPAPGFYTIDLFTTTEKTSRSLYVPTLVNFVFYESVTYISNFNEKNFLRIAFKPSVAASGAFYFVHYFPVLD